MLVFLLDVKGNERIPKEMLVGSCEKIGYNDRFIQLDKRCSLFFIFLKR